MLNNPRDENSLSSKFRRRRDVGLRALIASISAELGSVRVLDMGGTYEYWNRVGFDFLRQQRVTISILNRMPSQLTPEPDHLDVISSEVGDACNLARFADNAFDLAHSNSVIEHVFTWENMKSFASETRRVACNYYVQTPYFWFPIDPHHYHVPMFHWLPGPLQARMLNVLPISYFGRVESVDDAYYAVDETRMLDGRQFRFLFPDAEISYERFFGLVKSMLAVRRAERTRISNERSH